MRLRIKGEKGWNDIKSFFTPPDTKCMREDPEAVKKITLHLNNWRHVREHSIIILKETSIYKMPQDIPMHQEKRWSDQWLSDFQEWMLDGSPYDTATNEVRFFSHLGEISFYGNSPDFDFINNINIVRDSVVPKWNKWASAADAQSGAKKQELFVFLNANQQAKDAILKIDSTLCAVFKNFFGGDIDLNAVRSAFENFGRDRFPKDIARKNQFPLNAEATYHRMPSTDIWFECACQVESAILLKPADDSENRTRLAMLQGLLMGAVMDFNLRPDLDNAPCQTLPPDERRANLPDNFKVNYSDPLHVQEKKLRDAVCNVKDADTANTLRNLYRLYVA